MRITRDEYLKAKKLIAEYDLEQVVLSNQDILEDAMARGFVKGAEVVFTPDDSVCILTQDPACEHGDVLAWAKKKGSHATILPICNREGQFFCKII